MGVRIDESGKYHAAAQIDFLRAAYFAKGFDAAARTHGSDSAAPDKDCAIADDAEIAHRCSTARDGSAEGKQLGTAGDDDISHVD